MSTKKIYSGVHTLPKGRAPEQLTPGCLLLEGGSFRGLYTGGVLDKLMECGINFTCTAGVSAGALNGFNYVAGQIGRASRFNLTFRHDSHYVGFHAMLRNKGLFGFDMVFDDARNREPFDRERFFGPERRFIAVATDCLTGRPAYLEKGVCPEIFCAIQASASMPLVSKMVTVENRPYLDGGCSVAIPLDWALKEGFEKIVIVRTRDRAYRKTEESRKMQTLQKLFYRKYPQFLAAMLDTVPRYNAMCDRIDRLEKNGEIFVIAPSSPITVTRLEKDMEKLGALYWQGYREAEAQVSRLLDYLAR